MKNVLIHIHGMTVVPTPYEHMQEYKTLWHALLDQRPELEQHFEPFEQQVCVEYSHELPGFQGLGWQALRADQRLMRAQNTLRQRCDPAVIAAEAANDEREQGLPAPNPLLHPLRAILHPGEAWAVGDLKDTVELMGLTDVVYYVSPDGEAAVRTAVYGEVLDALEAYKEEEVRLFLLTHSLGVTVAHDFLFGLFHHAEGYTPGFPAQAEAHLPLLQERVRKLAEQSSGSSKPDSVVQQLKGRADAAVKRADKAPERFRYWRERAQAGTLAVGAFVAAASQLPLLVMRKQMMVDILAGDGALNPADIGILPRRSGSDPNQWLFVYDRADILGFPSRLLYAPNDRIRQIEVSNGLNPLSIHSLYWNNTTVLNAAADLLLANTGG